MLLNVLIQRQIPWLSLEALQNRCVEEVQRNPELGFLLVSEPEPAYTYGRFATSGDLLWSRALLKRKKIAVHAVSPGGKWTFHGPGQILVYPIFQLGRMGSRRAVRDFLKTLRDSVSADLLSLGISAESSDKPFGIYVAGKKLASFGIAVQKGVSSHGLALYYREQSVFFEGIHPCGVKGEQMTSLRECGVSLSWEEVASSLVGAIKKGFKIA